MKKKTTAAAEVGTKFLRFEVQNYTTTLSLLAHKKGSEMRTYLRYQEGCDHPMM